MKSTKEKYKEKTTLKLWLPMVVAILVPLLLVNITVLYLLGKIKQEDYTENLERMRQTHASFELLLNEANATVWLVTSDTKIVSLGLEKNGESFAANISFAKADIIKKQLSFYDTFGYSTSFYFEGADIFLSANGFCGSTEKFYGNLYQVGDLTLEALRTYALPEQNLSTVLPLNKVTIDGKSNHGIIILERLSNVNRTLAITVIQQKKLDELFALLTKENGMSYITDQNGTVLYRYGKDVSPILTLPKVTEVQYVDEHPYGAGSLVTSAGLSKGYRIVSINPVDVIYQDTVRLQAYVWVLDIVCSFLALFLSFAIVSRRISRMKTTLRLLSPQATGKDNKVPSNFYSQIDAMFSTLSVQNIELTHQVQSHQQVLVNSFWDNVFAGALVDASDFSSAARQAGVELHHPYYCVMMLASKANGGASATRENPSRNKELSYRLSAQNTNSDVQFHQISALQEVIIFGLTAAQKGTYRETVCDWLADKGESFDLNRECIVVSEVFDLLSEVYYHHSLNKAILGNVSLSQTNLGIIWSADSGNKLANEFYFPTELENRITSGIVTGNSSIVKEGFRLVIANNFESKTLTPTMFEIVRSKLRIIIATGYQSDMGFSLQDVFAEISNISADTSLLSYSMKICSEMCAFYQDGNRKNTTDLKQQIIDYIENNFACPELTLGTMAEHFSFSEAHFSRMLKELLGETFSAYLEKIRMERADALVMNTTMKMDEIARNVSYENVDSFRRAYKRYIGSSPSERRQNKKT